MQIEFKSNGRNWALVKVPVNTKVNLTDKIYNGILNLRDLKTNTLCDCIPLPIGNWQLISDNAHKMEEVECMPLVDRNEVNQYKSYEKHCTNVYFFGFDTAKESWHSLLTSLECYEVNPMMHPSNQIWQKDQIMFNIMEKTYSQSEQRTGRWVLIGEVV